MTKEIRIYNDPVRSIEIASKPHDIALLLKDEVKNHPIAKAICTDIPIRSYEYVDYENAIKALVVRLAVDFGSNITDEDLIVLTGRLLNFISNRYHFLTIKEVDMAFENGTTAENADKLFLSFKTVASFLSKYVNQRQAYIGNKYTQADISRINRDWKSKSDEINDMITDAAKLKNANASDIDLVKHHISFKYNTKRIKVFIGLKKLKEKGELKTYEGVEFYHYIYVNKPDPDTHYIMLKK